jgi:V/A-type H+-transporting ATPase subunit D
MSDRDLAPTQAAVLALREERTVVTEAYDFLDEKRLLLAAELLRQLDAYERRLAEMQALARTARERLAAAVRRHGLQGLEVYPAARLDGLEFAQAPRNFMGVTLVTTQLGFPAADARRAPPASNPSAEAGACREVFLELVRQGAALAEHSGNLHRLLQEYRATERRARALENVILPEIEQALGEMSVHLEEIDREDVIRARLHRLTGVRSG